jgi:hypothetical protein
LADIFLYQIFEGLTVVFESFIVLQYISGLFEENSHEGKRIFGYLLFSFGLVLISLFVRTPLILISYTLIGIYTLESLLYQSNVSSKIFSVLYFAAVMIVSEVLCSALITQIWVMELTDVSNYGMPRMLAILIAKLIQLFIVRVSVVLAKWEKDDLISVSLKMTFPLLICQICSILLAYHIYDLTYNIYGKFKFSSFISMTSIIIINIIMFWYFDRIKTVYSLRMKNEAMQMKYNLESEYYLALAEHQKETDALWHDMKKHILLMKSLVQNVENNISEEYLEELELDMKDKIKIVRTKQPIISALLTEQLKRADKADIYLDLDVKLEAESKVRPVDLCVMLGNLFENAFEACSVLSLGTEKLIKVEIKQRESSLIIRMENPRNPGAKRVKRPGKHGLGLNNIRKAVSKYNGNVEINIFDKSFVVDIVIP